jgi:hypothetical protein
MPFKGSKLYLHNSRERERERERDVKSHIPQLKQNITSFNKIGLDELTYQ